MCLDSHLLGCYVMWCTDCVNTFQFSSFITSSAYLGCYVNDRIGGWDGHIFTEQLGCRTRLPGPNPLIQFPATTLYYLASRGVWESIPGNPLSPLAWYWPKRKVLDVTSPKPLFTHQIFYPMWLIARPTNALLIIIYWFNEKLWPVA